jgi:hypothetical protein
MSTRTSTNIKLTNTRQTLRILGRRDLCAYRQCGPPADGCWPTNLSEIHDRHEAGAAAPDEILLWRRRCSRFPRVPPRGPAARGRGAGTKTRLVSPLLTDICAPGKSITSWGSVPYGHLLHQRRHSGFDHRLLVQSCRHARVSVDVLCRTRLVPSARSWSHDFELIYPCCAGYGSRVWCVLYSGCACRIPWIRGLLCCAAELLRAQVFDISGPFLVILLLNPDSLPKTLTQHSRYTAFILPAPCKTREWHTASPASRLCLLCVHPFRCAEQPRCVGVLPVCSAM